MSDTPKTDKFEIDYFNEDTSHVDDVFEYARQLERENAALREALLKVKAMVRAQTPQGDTDSIIDAALDAAGKEQR